MPLAGEKIAFIGKGGSGKSTCLILLARAMQRRGYEVCVLDTDSTNVGLHAALGIARPPKPLIDHFGGMVFLGGQVTCPVDDPTPLLNPQIDLADLPAEYLSRSAEGIVLLGAGKLADFGVGSGCDGPLVKIARDLILMHHGRPMLTLVDLKAGIEDTARGVLVGMDQAIVVTDPSTAGIGIAVYMSQLIGRLQAGAEPATHHLESAELADVARKRFSESRLAAVHVILNRVIDEDEEQEVHRMLDEHGIEPIAVIPHQTALRRAWLRSQPLPTADLADEVDRAVGHIDAGVDAAMRVAAAQGH